MSTPKLCSSACNCSRGAADVLGCSCTKRPVSTSRARRSRSSPRWGGTALSAKRGPPTSTISSAISDGGAALWRGVVLSTLRSWTWDDESVDGAALSAGGRGTPWGMYPCAAYAPRAVRCAGCEPGGTPSAACDVGISSFGRRVCTRPPALAPSVLERGGRKVRKRGCCGGAEADVPGMVGWEGIAVLSALRLAPCCAFTARDATGSKSRRGRMR